MKNDIVRTNSAITYFEEEIRQMKLQLKGCLNPEYREHLENKLSHYELALENLKATCVSKAS